MKNSVLIVCTQSEGAAPKRNDVVYTDLLAEDTESESNVSVKCTLLESPKRLNHLLYDTVEKMADSAV